MIKNTIDYNIQSLLNYKFYNVRNKSITENLNCVQINDFQHFIRPEFEYKIYESNSSFSKIYINLNNLPDDFNINKFIDDFNQYLKNINYLEEINYEKYNERILHLNQIIQSDCNNLENQEIKYLEQPNLTPIYLITKNNKNKNIHIIVNYYSYFIDDILYMMSEFSILNLQYKPYIDLTSYLHNHYLRCIYQQGILKNQKNYYEIWNSYSPDYPSLNLMNVIDNQTKILLSFININELNLLKVIKTKIDFDYFNNNCICELLMKMIEYYNL